MKYWSIHLFWIFLILVSFFACLKKLWLLYVCIRFSLQRTGNKINDYSNKNVVGFFVKQPDTFHFVLLYSPLILSLDGCSHNLLRTLDNILATGSQTCLYSLDR